MPGSSIRHDRSICSAIRFALLGTLLLPLLFGCNRTVAAATEGPKAKPQAKAAGAAARTAALIDMDRTPAGALLENRLSESTSLTWLERENIAALLKEQELQALFSPQAGTRRTALGQLLKVDLLVLLRSVRDTDGKEPQPLVHLVVCETRNGLRLCSCTLPVKDLKECVAEMERQVQTALRKQQEKIRVVWAVPPFVSKDLRYQFDYLKAAYARLVEQVLLGQKGTLVVELAEADAIASEHRLTGSEAGPQRQLPLYFLGEYRNEQADGKRRVSVGLKLKQGERILGAAQQTKLAADKVPGFLLKATGDLIKRADGVEQQKFNPEAEVVQLTARARTFLKLGSWSEALALVEASLLLKPSQPALHHEAARACCQLAQDYHGRHLHKKLSNGQLDPKKEGDLKARALAYRYYLRGLEHEEIYLDAEGKSPLGPRKKPPVDRPVCAEVWQATWLLLQGRGELKNSPEESDPMRQEAQAILLRLARQRTRNGWGDGHRYFTLALQTVPTLRERFALIRQMIVELQDLPGARQRTVQLTDLIRYDSSAGPSSLLPYDTPEFQEYVKELERIPNKDVRAGAEEVRGIGLRIHASYERLREAKRRGLVPYSNPASLIRASLEQFGSAEVDFLPTYFSWKSSGSDVPFGRWWRCVPAGPGRDCLWDFRGIYLMKEKDVVQPVWISKGRFRFDTVCYDGRYVWAGGCEFFGSPSLLVLDPASGKTWQVTAEDGLPILSPEERAQRKIDYPKLAAAPLGPGRICLAGYFGRSWVAKVFFDAAKEKAAVKVFHEAREVINVADKEKWKSASTAFVPKHIFTLTSSDGDRPEKRVLIDRRGGAIGERVPPLIVDPQKETVEVMRDVLPEIPLMALTGHQGAMYFVGPAIWNTAKRKYEQRLARVAFPGDKVETLLPDVPTGWLVSKGDQLYLVGKEWRELNLKQRELRTMADKLPWPFDSLSPSNGRDMLDGVFPSSHYGFLAVVRHFNKNPSRLVFETLQVVVKKNEALPPRKGKQRSPTK
ncbi:MAG TPA: hypothetical protein VMG10_17175 [Gemmataceae bacterium]|nr:hypothetical protein [Gemmataceae bacterium]